MKQVKYLLWSIILYTDILQENPFSSILLQNDHNNQEWKMESICPMKPPCFSIEYTSSKGYLLWYRITKCVLFRRLFRMDVSERMFVYNVCNNFMENKLVQMTDAW